MTRATHEDYGPIYRSTGPRGEAPAPCYAGCGREAREGDATCGDRRCEAFVSQRRPVDRWLSFGEEQR